MLEPHMFVFVDESSTDKLLSLRSYGFSLKGTHAVTVKKLAKGQWLSAIAAIPLNGAIDVNRTGKGFASSLSITCSPS